MGVKSLIRKIVRKLKNYVSEPQKSNLQLFVEGGGQVGEGCSIYSDVFFGSEPYLITIGNHVRVSYGVKFATHDGGVWTLRKMGILENADVFGPITVGDNTNIGWNVIILPGVNIGKNCVIGAGAVVTKDIPDNSVAVGVPARVIETVDEYYEKIKEKCDFTKDMGKSAKKAYLLNKYQKTEEIE